MWQMATEAWLSGHIFTLGCDIRPEAKNKLLFGLIYHSRPGSGHLPFNSVRAPLAAQMLHLITNLNISSLVAVIFYYSV